MKEQHVNADGRDPRWVQCPFCGTWIGVFEDGTCPHIICEVLYPETMFQFGHCADDFARDVGKLCERVESLQSSIEEEQCGAGEVDACITAAPSNVQSVLSVMVGSPRDEIHRFIGHYSDTVVEWSDSWGAGIFFFAASRAKPLRSASDFSQTCGMHSATKVLAGAAWDKHIPRPAAPE